ncbi:MAG: Ig-like domain-containing protein [Methanobacterium sp.]
MTAPRDGRIDGYYGLQTVRNRALAIIGEVNAATIPSYPNNITLTPQTTTVANGQTVTLTATVKDKDGNPLSGITVNFQTTAGTLSSSSGTTNANGQVTTTLTLGNNSDSVVTAFVTGNYGNLLYDDQYADVRKQNIVARNVFPLTISDFSTVKTTTTANVALTQTATSPVNVGNTVTYTVTATNNGPATATGILISDIVPAGLSGVTVTPSVGTYYNGIWTIPTLANGAQATLTITGTATAAMAGLTTTNTATRTAQEQYNSMPITTTASVYTKKVDVTITNTANHSTLNVGDNGTFTIRVTNNGPDLANIQITDLLSQLPAGFSAGTPSTGSYNPTTGVWTITNLATGTANAATLVFSGIIQAAQAGTTIINHATATMTEYPQTVTIPDASIYVKKADVSLSQTGSYHKNTVTFIVTASNNGPDTATNIKISDVIPDGLTNVTITPSVGSYTNGVWTIPSLAHLANATLNITGTATPQTTVTNTANKTSQTEYDPKTPDITKFSVYVPSVNMYVILRPWYYDTKANTYQTTSDCGNTIVYSLNVRNYGSDDATGVITKFTLGNGYQFIGCSIESVDTTHTNYVTYDNATRTLTWYIGFMPRNGMSYLKIIAKVIGTTTTSNLTCTGNLHSVDQHDIIGSYPKTASYSITTPVSADIEVKQTQQTFTDTENNLHVTYTITVKNNGPDNATGVQITDKLPTGLTDISYTISNDNGQTWTDNDPSYNPNNGIWNIGNFNATDQPKILKITAKVTGTGTIKNTASRTAINEKDYNYDNNAQTCVLTVSGTYTPSSNIYVILRPWYYDTKANTYQTTSDCGNTIVYSLNVRNYGSDDATGVITKFTLGNGYQFIGCSIESVDTTHTNYVTYDNATRTLTWYIGFMPRNGMSYLKIIAKVIGTTTTSNLTCTGNLHSVDQHDIIGSYPKTASYSITTPVSADIEVKQTQQTFTDTENNSM